MASVRIDSGPPDANDRPYNIPKNKWFFLFQEKRSFIVTHIAYDCRCLLNFVQDAEIMWQELKFTSAQDMIINGYELDPQEVELALEWLKIKDPDDAVRYEVAVQGGRELKRVGAPEGNQNASKNNPYNISIDLETEKQPQYGTQKSYLLARLARDNPDILAAYQSGEYPSARQAAIAAGIVRVPTPLEIAIKAYNRLTDADKKKFADYIRNETTIDN